MKFSIRDLLLVTVIVAVVVAWWMDRSRLREQLRQQTMTIEVYKALVESMEATQNGRTAYYKALADAQTALADRNAALKAATEILQDAEGSVRENNLLGPPPSNSKP